MGVSESTNASYWCLLYARNYKWGILERTKSMRNIWMMADIHIKKIGLLKEKPLV